MVFSKHFSAFGEISDTSNPYIILLTDMELYTLVPDRGVICVVLYPSDMKPQIHFLANVILPSVKLM